MIENLRLILRIIVLEISDLKAGVPSTVNNESPVSR